VILFIIIKIFHRSYGGKDLFSSIWGMRKEIICQHFYMLYNLNHQLHVIVNLNPLLLGIIGGCMDGSNNSLCKLASIQFIVLVYYWLDFRVKTSKAIVSFLWCQSGTCMFRVWRGVKFFRQRPDKISAPAINSGTSHSVDML